MQRYPELYPQEEDKESPSQAESTSGSVPEGSALSPETDSIPTTSAPESAVSSDSTSPTDA